MMLYKVSDDRYLGFYSEYGGTVTITGSKNGRPVYSFAGERDEYRMLEYTRGTRDLPWWKFGKDKFTLRETGTGHLSSVSADFVGVAKSVGANEFVVPG